ncbi:transcriptional regulator, TetR family [Altererythrobacter xiamenensis]|uniref:Transcriptional regulator, TetR family n=2 Tax=Altererythrobacter xiamenensis TaxID=1316679 RepID=A0A1Y6EM11_9SPHN|nr:transcriptional regulator, TetR family [Altererythrobacter xiamenensis]
MTTRGQAIYEDAMPPAESARKTAAIPEAKPQRWQQRKAAMTREVILDAATDCLVEDGYAALTTVEVINRAGVSRGAMHHHFANRSELLAALIDHVLHKRLERFLSEYLSTIEDSDPARAIEVATDVHWHSVQTPEYAAYLELLMAARTDAELQAILVPATNAFEREWMSEMEKALPQWMGAPKEMLLANDLAASLHLGLLINRPYFADKERRRAVRDKLVDLVKEVYRTAKP